MKFSIITPSYLEEYAGGASQRELKLARAIQSVLDQKFQDWELIVIADGCFKTPGVVRTFNDPRIRLLEMEKAPIWSGMPRNAGLDNAKGDFITYLDSDDYLGPGHLETINANLGLNDWIYYSDWIYNFERDSWHIRPCDIRVSGQNGTSNITHRRSLPVRWSFEGYGHDHYFNQQLQEASRRFRKTPPAEYYVMHMNGYYDL